MAKKIDVIGIGHPLMDLCIEVEDKLLDEFGLAKGTMHIVSPSRFTQIYSRFDKDKIKVEFGGSVPNTIDGLRLLGCVVAEYGRVGSDEYGEMSIKDRMEKGIECYITKDRLPTGSVISMITPDGERTFAVCLGAATELCSDDIDEKVIRAAKIIHFTGYELESPKVKEAIEKAVKAAKGHDVLVSFDLADPGVIQRNFIALKAFIDENVDILFANEDEIEEFTGCVGEEAFAKISQRVKYAVIKNGEKGSMIRAGENIYIIDACKAIAKDTTGAGDMYAAGILYGIIKGLPMEKVGRIASYAAAKVVEKIGARLGSLELPEDL